MKLGSYIKEFRLGKGLSQTEFAKEFGVSTTTINRIEKNKYKLGLKTLKILSKITKKTINEIREMEHNENHK